MSKFDEDVKTTCQCNNNVVGNCAVCGKALAGNFLMGNGSGKMIHYKCWYRTHPFRPATNLREVLFTYGMQSDGLQIVSKTLTSAQHDEILTRFNAEMAARHKERAGN